MEIIHVTVIHPLGLHARPASLLARIVQGYDCDVEVWKRADKKQHITNVISIMALGAVRGDKLIFELRGRDEKAAAEAISKFINEGRE